MACANRRTTGKVIQYMTDLNDIKDSIEGSAEWVANRQAIHIKRMTTAVHDLENSIINSLSQLKVNKGGSLASLRLNTKNLQTAHKDVILAFETDFNGAAKTVTNDFKNVEANLVKSYMKLDETVSFSGADKATMDVLSNSAYQEYVAIGGQAREKVVQSLYGNVLGGKGMSDLITDIQGVLGGSVSRTGRPLVNYARLYANDMIMNFQNDVNLSKGEQIGMKSFLYYGSVIASTRDFCKRRVGQVYTKKQILSWKGGWSGKRGDAWTFRGGWNCRHHWQPVRKEWVQDFGPIEMQNYFTDSKLKMPKPVLPWGAEVKQKSVGYNSYKTTPINTKAIAYENMSDETKEKLVKAFDWSDETNDISQLMNELSGADGLPTVVSSAEFNRLAIKADEILLRGIRGKKYAQEFIDGGFYPGRGVYGDGTYTVANKISNGIEGIDHAVHTTIRYGDDSIRMMLKSDSKTIFFDKAVELMEAETKYVGTFKKIYQGDPGRWALANGYDAIILKRDLSDFIVVLNRQAIIVDKNVYTNDSMLDSMRGLLK